MMRITSSDSVVAVRTRNDEAELEADYAEWLAEQSVDVPSGDVGGDDQTDRPTVSV